MIPRLHLVTDDAVLQQPEFVTIAARITQLLGPRVAVHVRARTIPVRALFDIVRALPAQPALVVVNDRVDLAMTAGARAVQLGARSLPIPLARRLAGGLTIGYSAHSPAEAADAERDGADFILAGSIFQTASHPGQEPAGVAVLAQATARCRVPVLAIGGVTRERLAEVRDAGAYGVAVIRAVWHAPDPVQAAQQFAKMLEA